MAVRSVGAVLAFPLRPAFPLRLAFPLGDDE